MNNVFELILLVGDKSVSNFFNRIILEQTGSIKSIVSLDNCLEALEFVDKKKNLNPVPDLIFLNLHTPFMNAWEFLEKYEKLEKIKESHIIILYDTELLEEEKNKLDQYFCVKAVHEKTLDTKILNEVYKVINRKKKIAL